MSYFEPRSLNEWMTVCRLAGVDAVRAEPVSAVRPSGLLEALDAHDMDHTAARALRIAEEQRPDGWMLRWDWCSTGALKHHMAQGRDPAEFDEPWLMVDDPRLVSILTEVNREAFYPVWTRPWADVEYEDRYPVEFRVFHKGSGEMAVSSYYPQRPLPDGYKQTARDAAELAGALAEHVHEPFSADFLFSSEKGLRFLEGGPPHGELSGAHPCCFAPGELDGIALKPREGALTH